jgi:predicted dehydrogenase
MSSTLRVGFIGAGRMANLHAGLIADEPDVRIVAAADIDAAKAGAFVTRWGGAAFTDHRALLEQTPLDAVYICTPTTQHAAIGLDCLEFGVALYVEKPLDLDLRTARRLVEAAEARGVLAMTGFQWRYSEGYRRAEELIGDSPIALATLRWYWTRPPIRWMWDRALAGGQIVDQNIHLIDVGSGLAGDVTTVYAAYNDRQANYEAEFANWDGYALTLHFGHGAVGVCAGTYALFPEIQFEPAADFACATGWCASPTSACNCTRRAASRRGRTRSRSIAASTVPSSPPCVRATARTSAHRCAPGCWRRRPCWRPITRRRRARRSTWRRSWPRRVTDDNSNSQPTVALAAIARPTFDVPLAQSVAATTLAQLAQAGLHVVGGDTLIMDADGATHAQQTLLRRGI